MKLRPQKTDLSHWITKKDTKDEKMLKRGIFLKIVLNYILYDSDNDSMFEVGKTEDFFVSPELALARRLKDIYNKMGFTGIFHNDNVFDDFEWKPATKYGTREKYMAVTWKFGKQAALEASECEALTNQWPWSLRDFCAHEYFHSAASCESALYGQGFYEKEELLNEDENPRWVEERIAARKEDSDKTRLLAWCRAMGKENSLLDFDDVGRDPHWNHYDCEMKDCETFARVFFEPYHNEREDEGCYFRFGFVSNVVTADDEKVRKRVRKENAKKRKALLSAFSASAKRQRKD